jgi:hypothetical protein
VGGCWGGGVDGIREFEKENNFGRIQYRVSLAKRLALKKYVWWWWWWKVGEGVRFRIKR